MFRRPKVYALVAAGALVAGGVACGSDKDDAKGSGTTKPPAASSAAPASAAASSAPAAAGAAKGMKIVYVPGLTGNPFYNTVACGAQAKAKELGAEFKYQGAAEFDVAKQSAIVSALVGEKPSAIMISITDPKAMIGPLKEAKDAGINIIAIDGDLSDESIMSTNIQSDNLVGGALAAKSLVEAVGEDLGGEVVGISNNPGSTIGEQREKGFKDELAKHPKFKYLGTQFSKNQQAEAAKIVSVTASSNKKLVGVYTMATNNTEGAVTGLREAGKKPTDVKIVGYDISAPIQQALKDGTITGTVVQFPYGAGQKGVEAAVALANGQTVPRNQATDFVFATPTNLDTPDVQKFIYKLDCK
ncbi:MAG: ABC transporter substrate-binding protein [Mycobacteriales bacterium]